MQRKVAAHPEHIAATDKAETARLRYDRILGEQIVKQTGGRAKRNSFGQWNETQVSAAQREPEVQEASRDMYQARRVRSEVETRLMRPIPEEHDGTEHPADAQFYPKGEERKRIVAAFERFVTALRDTGAIHKAFGLPRISARGSLMALQVAG